MSFHQLWVSQLFWLSVEKSEMLGFGYPSGLAFKGEIGSVLVASAGH